MAMLLFLYLLLPAAQILFFLSGRPLTGAPEALNYCASILAVHWMSANVLLSTKIPLLQRVIPYDRRIRFHILSSAGLVTLVAYHGVYKLVLGKTLDGVTWILLGTIAGMLIFAVLWIPVPTLVAFRSSVLGVLRRGKELSYDRTKALHGYFVLALGPLLFLHVAAAGLFDDVPPLSTALYVLLLVVSFGGYALTRTGIFGVGATVSAVEGLRGITTIRLIPDRPHRFRSGQFAFLRAKGTQARPEEHPFSYLSHSGESELAFAVRACGDFTGALTALKVGDRVRLSGGFGDFRPRREKSLCFIASGIGTVPFISILKELHASGDQRELRFFLAVTYEEEIPDLEELRRIASRMPNLVLRFLIYSVDGLLYSADFFRRELPDPLAFSYYLCSSPRVRGGVLQALQELGVRRRAIRYEAFSLG